MTFNFPEILILVLLGILFFKEEMKTWIPKLLGIKPSNPSVGLSDIGGKMDKLAGHFNHETTTLLTEIRDDLKGQGRMTTTILQRVEEIIKYGVLERKP